MEYFFIIVAIAILGCVYQSVYLPFVNGSRMIDPLTKPTLARIQRIIRARDTKAREKEYKLKALDRQKREATAIEAATTKHESKLYEGQTKHYNLISAWDKELADITREEDERKLAEQKALEEAVRKRELEVWTANEKIRIQEYRDQRELEVKREKEERLAELSRREKEYSDKQRYWSKPEPEMTYTERRVGVHSVNVRNLPHTATTKIGNLVQGEIATIDGWVTSEDHHGNDIWFRTEIATVGSYGYSTRQGWVWSGSFTNTSTSGLPNLNENTDEFISRNAMGQIVHRYKAPSILDTQIQEDLSGTQRVEKARTEMQKNTDNAIDTLAEMYRIKMKEQSPKSLTSGAVLSTGTGLSLTNDGLVTSNQIWAPPAEHRFGPVPKEFQPIRHTG